MLDGGAGDGVSGGARVTSPAPPALAGLPVLARSEQLDRPAHCGVAATAGTGTRSLNCPRAFRPCGLVSEQTGGTGRTGTSGPDSHRQRLGRADQPRSVPLVPSDARRHHEPAAITNPPRLGRPTTRRAGRSTTTSTATVVYPTPWTNTHGSARSRPRHARPAAAPIPGHCTSPTATPRHRLRRPWRHGNRATRRWSRYLADQVGLSSVLQIEGRPPSGGTFHHYRTGRPIFEWAWHGCTRSGYCSG